MTPDEFDRLLAAGEPVELNVSRDLRVTSRVRTWGSSKGLTLVYPDRPNPGNTPNTP